MMNRAKFGLTLAAIAICSVLSLTQTASAQSINVTTPFAFSAGNQLYPAGTYQFTMVSEWNLSIRNVNRGGEKFFTIFPSENNRMQQYGGLTFHNVEGNKTLQAVYVPGMERAAVLTEPGTKRFKAENRASVTEINLSAGKASTGEQQDASR